MSRAHNHGKCCLNLEKVKRLEEEALRDRIRMLEERAKLSDEENNTLKKNLKASEAKNCRLMEQIKNLNEQRRQQS